MPGTIPVHFTSLFYHFPDTFYPDESRKSPSGEGAPAQIPHELGMKIWVLRAYSLEPGTNLHRLKTDLFQSRVIAEFFIYGQKDYLQTSL